MKKSLNDKFKEIIERCNGSVYIEINDHISNYETIEEYIKAEIDEIEPKIIKEMIRKNICIRVQFYPDTNIGFYIVYHYDINKALKQVIDILNNN